MAWLIQHKCSPYQPNVGEYAMAKLDRNGEKLTLVRCSSCGEEFHILGHEMFDSGNAGPAGGLPPGFVVATRKPS